MPNRSQVLKCRLCESQRDICLRYMTGYLVPRLHLQKLMKVTLSTRSAKTHGRHSRCGSVFYELKTSLRLSQVVTIF